MVMAATAVLMQPVWVLPLEDLGGTYRFGWLGGCFATSVIVIRFRSV